MESSMESCKRARKDPSSSANSEQVVVSHWDWDVVVDFKEKTLRCTATLEIRTLCEDVGSLILDCVGLVVSEVTSRENGETLPHQVKHLEGELTPCLDITLPSTCAQKGAKLGVCICYETDPDLCAAVQWLEPEQTAGKKLPYLFTGCQMIHAREMLPCQDTPSVKSTFSAKVTVPCELVALMGAERLGNEPHPTDSTLCVYSFKQNVPIPSYLAAMVVGALESKRIGPRSHVWCEKELVEKAAWEFGETEKMLCAAEEVVGEYLWGQYDILLLPSSFPYGGMENPCLTFLHPSLLAGDRSLANVVAHELSHSWTGNLVTNENWEEFWLNEGFTTYLERRIAAKVFNEKERHLQASVGWNQMEDAIRGFEKRGKEDYTLLVPKLTGLDPDEVYSCIPYEKGSSFLFYLETLIGGPGSLDGFLKAYIAKYRYGTVITEQWKEFFLDYFNKEVSAGVFEQVEWDKWISAPGMPPLKPKFDTTLADASMALAEKWASVKDASSIDDQFSNNDISGMSSGAIQFFLDKLFTKPPLSVEVLVAMDKCYGFNKTQNAEIKYRWFRLCLRGKWSAVYPLVTELLSNEGRMKYIVPLYSNQAFSEALAPWVYIIHTVVTNYRELCECGEDAKTMAVSTFIAHKQFYHMVATKKISKILQLS